MFNIIFVSSTSITIELENKDIYETSPYDIKIGRAHV